MQNEVVLWQSCTYDEFIWSTECLLPSAFVPQTCRAGDQWCSHVRGSVLWVWVRKSLKHALYPEHRISPVMSSGLLTPLPEIWGELMAESAHVKSVPATVVLSLDLLVNSEQGITCEFPSLLPFALLISAIWISLSVQWVVFHHLRKDASK